MRKRNLEILCRSCNTCAHIFLLGRRARETLVGMHAQAQAFRRPPPSARTHLSSQPSRCTPRAVEVPGAFGNALQRAPSPLLRTLHQSKGASEKMRRADRESGGFRILCPRPVNHSQICFCNFGTLPDSIGPRVSHCLQDEWYRLFGGEASRDTGKSCVARAQHYQIFLHTAFLPQVPSGLRCLVLCGENTFGQGSL